MKTKRFKRIAAFLISLVFIFQSILTVSAIDKTDNSELLKYKTSEETGISKSYCDGIIETPDWVDSLIIVEVRPDTASVGGTFAECYDLIDFYAEVGVNGIWLTPVYDKSEIGNGYSNRGPHTIDPKLTGKDNYEDGWQELAKFVAYAHSKGIYIFLDVITWGVVRDAPLIDEHPDWSNGEAWGNIAFDWSNKELYNWFRDTLINNILTTDADGFRCDCEPNHSGYDMYREVRNTLSDIGKKIIVICEDTCKRSGVYDFEQDGVLDYSSCSRGDVYEKPVNFFGDGLLNIVDCTKKGQAVGYKDWQKNPIKRGTGKYYTNCITNHDYQLRDVCGSRINIGYSAIFAPYIPIWYMGDEFNASNEPGVLYDLYVDYSEAEDEEKAAFLEDVKQMIRIRRTYSNIFEYWPVNHRNSNICKVKTENLGSLQAYARYADNSAVIIAANNTDNSLAGTIKIPFMKARIDGYKHYTVTDLMSGKVIAEGSKNDVRKFTAEIGSNYVGVYLVEGDKPVSNLFISISSFFRALPERFYTIIVKMLSL
ncbi:MAG: alpha-amylase family glycosyl hydrolase [Clostridia bacterium]|nr:alpha-amylase family glycosyl hydrolase [Clostridia bacterium]